MFKKLQVTKMGAGEKQLKEAITLFFEDRDPISIHTLIFAANEIFYQLARAKGIKNTMRDADAIAKANIPGLKERLRASANFFKHAGRDPHKVHTFFTEENVHFLADSCMLYFKLASKWIPESRYCTESKVFMIWFMQKYPHIVDGGELKEKILELKFDEKDSEMLKECLEIVNKFKLGEGADAGPVLSIDINKPS